MRPFGRGAIRCRLGRSSGSPGGECERLEAFPFVFVEDARAVGVGAGDDERLPGGSGWRVGEGELVAAGAGDVDGAWAFDVVGGGPACAEACGFGGEFAAHLDAPVLFDDPCEVDVEPGDDVPVPGCGVGSAEGVGVGVDDDVRPARDVAFELVGFEPGGGEDGGFGGVAVAAGAVVERGCLRGGLGDFAEVVDERGDGFEVEVEGKVL